MEVTSRPLGEVHVGRLQRGEVRSAGNLLARAFAEDPVLTFVLAGTARRRIAYPAFFRAVLRGHRASGHVYAARDGSRLLGVAVWAPPEARRPPPADRVRAAAERAIVAAFFPRAWPVLVRGFDGAAALHPQEAHWYLAFVGVEPAWQGRGIGRLLLEPVLNQADRIGTGCYLETPFPGRVRFYARLGFEVVGEARPFRGAPPLITMVRRGVEMG